MFFSSKVSLFIVGFPPLVGYCVRKDEIITKIVGGFSQWIFPKVWRMKVILSLIRKSVSVLKNGLRTLRTAGSHFRSNREAAALIRRLRSGEVSVSAVNLCSGPQAVPGYFSVDLVGANLNVDLEESLLPFANDSIDRVVCMSAINYFTRERGELIVADIYRILKPGGIFRMGVQDLNEIAKRYVQRDKKFFFQQLNGRDRFEGVTYADKFNAWFYGYRSNNATCKYMYDYETLTLICENVGFSTIERKNFMESRLAHIEMIDNRPDQMFFLEAVKK